jgi:hypothetical protein
MGAEIWRDRGRDLASAPIAPDLGHYRARSRPVSRQISTLLAPDFGPSARAAPDFGHYVFRSAALPHLRSTADPGVRETGQRQRRLNPRSHTLGHFPHGGAGRGGGASINNKNPKLDGASRRFGGDALVAAGTNRDLAQQGPRTGATRGRELARQGAENLARWCRDLAR